MHERAIPKRSRLALIAYLFLVTASFGFLQPYLPLYYKAAGLSSLQIGLVFGAGTAVALLLQFVWGRLSDRLDSRRPFVVLAGVCSATAYLSFPHVSGVPALFALSALGQNGILYMNSVGGVLVGRMVDTRRGGAAYAGYRVWGSVGYVVVTLISGLLVNRAGTKIDRAQLDSLFSIVPFVFVAVIALAWFLPDPKNAPRKAAPLERPPLPANLKWFMLCTFLYIVSLYGTSNFLSIYMNSVGGSGLWVSAMFAGGVLCEIAVMTQSGRFSDRYGRRPLLALTFMLLPIRLALYIVAPNPLGVLLIQLLHGFNFGIMGAISVVLINDLSTNETRGQAQARLAAVSGLAGSVAPIILGLAAQASLHLMFGVASLIALGGAVVFLLKVEETHPECRPLAERGPKSLGPLLRLLDAPPGSRRPKR
jgi:MFS transporter, PPP family, 3-phenylpropionic acid transporter